MREKGKGRGNPQAIINAPQLGQGKNNRHEREMREKKRRETQKLINYIQTI